MALSDGRQSGLLHSSGLVNWTELPPISNISEKSFLKESKKYLQNLKLELKIIEYSDKILFYHVKGAEEEEKIMESFLNFLSDENNKGREISYQTKDSY